MPGMNGRELADLIFEMRPGIKTLFMSGYTANVIVRQGVLDDGKYFIQKPFSIQALSEKVRTAIESSGNNRK
jgi:FixJ family two-component response regulator